VSSSTQESDDRSPWYAGITRYQWLVLFIASLGWIFDTFEGQIFVASMNEAMPSLVPGGTPEGQIAAYNNIALAAFLLGGAVGGIGFGMLSDRIGRKRTLSVTILFYSLFTCLSAMSQEWWHLVAFRFLVALGVGGEWAVASALVAEVFPQRARPYVGSIFHGSSVIGSYLAAAAGAFLIGNAAIAAWAGGSSVAWTASFIDPTSLPWRLGFALGVLPALLVLWIRSSVREPESWQAASHRAALDQDQRMGSLSDLFAGALLRRTVVGVTLATVGLATFWTVHIHGRDVLRSSIEREFLAADQPASAKSLTPNERKALLAPHAAEIKRWEMLGMILVTTGGGVGLLAFGPLAQRLGRRAAFLVFHLGGLAAALILFNLLHTTNEIIVALPIFGCFTLGMHSGYAVYFPELYPTRLRATGAGFCFNGGRILAAPFLVLVAALRDQWGYSLNQAATLMSLLFLVGAAALIFAPETRGQDLPE
jgi:MFS family permease